MLKLATQIVLSLTLAAGACVHAEGLAQQAFDDLSKLEGEWQGSYANGRSHRVIFELTANGTALMETWVMSPTRRSLTMYALDGDRLLATHYCPQGNQPRLVLTERDAQGRYQFEFLDGTNLQNRQGSHQHTLTIEVDSAEAFARSEVYLSNAESDLEPGAKGETVRYQRATP